MIFVEVLNQTNTYAVSDNDNATIKEDTAETKAENLQHDDSNADVFNCTNTNQVLMEEYESKPTPQYEEVRISLRSKYLNLRNI